MINYQERAIDEKIEAIASNRTLVVENHDELFMMNFDLTRNLSKYFVYNNPLTVTFWMNFRKKKKIQANPKFKKVNGFKTIGNKKTLKSATPLMRGNSNYINSPRASGIQKNFFQDM